MSYTLSFRYTFADYRRLYRAVKQGSRFGSLPLVARLPFEALAFVGIAYSVACLMEGGWIDPTLPEVAKALGWTLAGFAVVRVAWDIFAVPLFLRAAFGRHAAADGTMEVRLHEDGFRWRVEPGIAGEAPWQAVKRITSIEGDLFLFISRVEAFPIPRRAVATAEEFATLEQFIREKLQTDPASRWLR